MTASNDTHNSKKSQRHGMSKSPEYNSWRAMKERCLNPNNKSFEYYGGRGVTVCESWFSFSEFYADMGDRPTGASLDRIDNDGPYSPENCVWSTHIKQCRNRRSNVVVEFNGEEMTIVELSELTGINYFTLHWRIARRGWSIEDATRKKDG